MGTLYQQGFPFYPRSNFADRLHLSQGQHLRLHTVNYRVGISPGLTELRLL